LGVKLLVDHVAMVLRFDQEEDSIFFFDATANVRAIYIGNLPKGVQISRWSKFRLFMSEVYQQ